MKHIDAAHLWIQDEIRSKRLRVRRVRSEENVADLGSKPLGKAEITKHCVALAYVNMATDFRVVNHVKESSQRVSSSRSSRNSGSSSGDEQFLSPSLVRRWYPRLHDKFHRGARHHVGVLEVEFFWNRIPHTASNSNELAHLECYNDIGFHLVSFSSTDQPSYPHVKNSNSAGQRSVTRQTSPSRVSEMARLKGDSAAATSRTRTFPETPTPSGPSMTSISETNSPGSQ